MEAGGIGYRLKVPASSASRLGSGPARDGGGTARLYTVCRFKDDAFHLYGFVTVEERNIFERVCSVTGVGPGIAMAILSGIPIDEFRTAVLTDQARVLEKIKGVGRKTAQRLVLELKDVLARDGGPVVLPAAGVTANRTTSDAIAALTAIGFAPGEAEASVSKAQRLHPDADLEELIKYATRY